MCIRDRDLIASDREYKFTYIPTEYKGVGTWYQRAPWKGKGKELRFTMNHQAIVYVTRRPDKKFGKTMRAQGFKGTGKYLKGQFGGAIQKLPVVKKLFPAGEVKFTLPENDVAPTVFVRPVGFNFVEPEAKPPTTTSAALKQLCKHVAVPKKCGKAIALMIKLLSKDQITREDGWPLTYRFLKVAMKDLERAYSSDVRQSYLDLFQTVAKKGERLCSPQQAQMINVWKLCTLTRDELSSDESFEFSKAVKALQKMIEELPLYNSAEDPSAGDASDDEAAAEEEEEEEEEEEDAEDDEEGNELAVLQTKRAALLMCVQQARQNYRFLWAKTTIDLLLQFVTENKSKWFSPAQCEQIQEWNVESLKDAMLRKQGRMQGRGEDKDKEGRTTFEVAETHWEAAKVSGRAAVVGGGRQNQGGQDGKMFGQNGGSNAHFI
eukprot:TRINITY_DN3817_c0_g2_i1.p1 TRINITY_DN3817_c0_g2~~TRINITY_DN3817_c0_g2_i1.p1  ORF type:complete len:434 (-),score=142.57 TRINITY_DN3817_c0_g2_i1:68-1369(-)